MSHHGVDIWTKALETATYAREELRKINGLRFISENIIGKSGIIEWDSTKLGILTNPMFHSGFEVEHMLNSKFNIEIELRL